MQIFLHGSDYSPSVIKPLSPINSEVFVDLFRDLELRFNRYYQAANGVSVLSNSLMEIMLSKIAKVENDISYLENFINNYDFISGKDDLYNYSYMENFDNALYSNEYDDTPVVYPDRDGINLSNGGFYIDQNSSKLKIGSAVTPINSIGLIKSVNLKTNYDQSISSSSDPSKLFEDKGSKVWSVSIKSPSILSTLPVDIEKYVKYDYSYILGAKVVMEVSLNKPTEMDVIKINPNASAGVKVMQVAILSPLSSVSSVASNAAQQSANYQTTLLLNSAVDIKNGFTLNMPLTKVSKIIFVLNQDTYTKTEKTSSENELISRNMDSIVKNIRDSKRKDHNQLQDLVLTFFRNSTSIDEAKRNTTSINEYYSYKYPVQSSIKDMSIYSSFSNDKKSFQDIYTENRIRNVSPLSRMVESIISHVLGSRFNAINNTMFKDNRNISNSGRLSTMTNPGFTPERNSNFSDRMTQNDADPIIPGLSFNTDGGITSVADTVNTYQYNFSIKSIQFFKTILNANSSSAVNNKAIFISKKIPVDGKILGLKAKINYDDNSPVNYSVVDLKNINSYELSFCFKENPNQESDWIAIVPFGSTKIESEVLFFNRNTKTAKLRFHSKSSNIRVYENGSLLNPNGYTVNVSSSNVLVNNFNENSIYVAEYDLDKDNYSQDYIDMSVLYSDTPISLAASDNSQGEYFIKTNSNNSVKLEKIPYIDYTKLTSASYNSRFGTVNTLNNLSYSPISVKMKDGSFAINLTNYIRGNFDKASFYETSETLFYQHGKELIFSKPITQPFNVIYNYINNKMRFRLIIRNNYKNIISAGSVDNVVIKMKTNNLDPLSERMLGI